MPKAEVINDIIEFKNLTVVEVEKIMGYSNGALGKAIKSNSDVKADKIEKLLSAYPDLNREYVYFKKGSIVNPKKEPPPDNADSPQIDTENINYAESDIFSQGTNNQESMINNPTMHELAVANRLHAQAYLSQAKSLERLTNLLVDKLGIDPKKVAV